MMIFALQHRMGFFLFSCYFLDEQNHWTFAPWESGIMINLLFLPGPGAY
jgi:hypothetical protein